ncbi:TetR/AcrR family transcriptional regulator [Amycolatopsis cihanbeyliensis]|uniref:TetR family transcriptional regulator n=1 Tax=Amycolatopsis cihanbeyliensis TaxID=1128664 RepID=A0A542DLC7_AMYCI|nr:TetR/AcrR family transcriptional regulator [Amycolatopsis cihanbeyliensis]TQJ03889.1 TetR family transcriptional regulator [Amycolatopsis cihanbeyliensis]
MAPKRVDRAARREEILGAAVRVFARKGFAASRIEDVAAAAGIGKGSVYLYFASREALLTAAFEELASTSADILREARADSRPALDRLAALVHAVLRSMAQRPELSRILLDLWSASRGGEGLPLDMGAVYADYRAAVAELLREAATEGAVRPEVGTRHATVVVAAVEGCLLQWLVDPRLPLIELADPIVSICLDGVRLGATR